VQIVAKAIFVVGTEFSPEEARNMLPKLTSPIPLAKNCEVPPPNMYDVHPNYPPDGGEAHPVKEGENFITIANKPEYKSRLENYRAKVAEPELFDNLSDELANARALIYFNYGTTVPEYVNWFLLNVTCCYHATDDKHNRRFSNYDAESKSPKYGNIKRAGQIYVPKDSVKPKPKSKPDLRPIRMWAHLEFHDGLFSWLNDIANARGAGTAEKLLEILEDAEAKRGKDYTPDELRKLAKLRKFAKPLRWGLKWAKRIGWAATVVDLIAGGRVVHGYLIMSYDDEPDSHYSWQINMVLKGAGVFTDSSGSFTTKDDKYTIRTSVFNPEKWDDNDLICTMTGNSIALSIKQAFRTLPHAGKPEERAFTKPSIVLGRPGGLDWTLSLRPNQSLGGGLAFFKTIPGLDARLTNGKRRNFVTVMTL